MLPTGIKTGFAKFNFSLARFFCFRPFWSSFRLKKKLVFIWQNRKDCLTFAPAFQMREDKFKAPHEGAAPNKLEKKVSQCSPVCQINLQGVAWKPQEFIDTDGGKQVSTKEKKQLADLKSTRVEKVGRSVGKRWGQGCPRRILLRRV